MMDVKPVLLIWIHLFVFCAQAKRIHWVRVPHPSVVLASARVSDTLCPAPRLHLLYAHSARRWIPHRRSSYCHPYWLPGAVKGRADTDLIISFVLMSCLFKSLLNIIFHCYPQTSVLHMCSLFHAFMFAQLWTIYCEQAAAAPSLQNQNQTEFSSSAILTGLEFWSRVTPSILQLMAHNKVVRVHFNAYTMG